MRIAIVGAGIGGLSTAFFLNELADQRGEELELSVFEASDRAGGKLHTFESEGFRIENGPNGFLSNEPATLQMVSDLDLGEELITASEIAANRFVYRGGELHPVKGPKSLVTTGLLTWVDKLSVLFEPLREKTPGDDPTVAEFVRNRMGPRFLNNLIEPMVAGIYAGDPEEMSLRATFPALWDLERESGSLLMGAFSRAGEDDEDSGGPAGPGGTLTSFERGMGQLAEALHDYLGGSLQTDTEVTELRRTGSGWTLGFADVKHSDEPAEFDQLVLATGPGAAANLLEPLSSSSAQALRAIPQPPVAVVALGFAESDFDSGLPGFGALTTRDSEVRCLGSLWSSTIFGNRAPQGHHLVRQIYGGARDPEVCDLPDEKLLETALDDLDRLAGARPGELTVSRVIRHRPGIPQYTVGHLDRLATLENEAERLGDLHLTGWSYRGVAVNKIAARGRELAEDLLSR